jgi:PAS domain S-box-containing protein
MSQSSKLAQPASKAAPVGAVDACVFESAFQNSPAMQSVIRASDGVLVQVNDTFLRTLGRTREQVIGKTPLELNSWVQPEKILEYRERLEREGFVIGYEAQLRASDGRIITGLLSSYRVEINGVLHYVNAGVDISERKRAEAALQLAHEKLCQSEERFGKAFHSSPAMMAITRLADSTFVAVNEAFLRAIGYREDEVIGRTGKELGLHVTSSQRDTFLQGVAEYGFVREQELVIRSKDGRLLTLLASGERTDIDGTPHLLSVALDITARKDAEARLVERERQLRESEARFSAAFRTSPIHMTIARLADGKFVEVNPAFLEMFGFQREEIIGRDSTELGLWVNPEDRADLYEKLKQGVVHNAEYQVQTRRGGVHTLQLSGEIIEINREPHLIVFGLDITDRKRAEQALVENEARTRSLYESISAAVAVHDENGFVQINSASLKLFGSDNPKDILGRQPDFFSAARQPDGEDSATAAKRHMERALAYGVERFEWLGRKIDGTEFPVEVTLTALQLEGRQALQAVIIDLTERKRAEAELQNALAKERELNQLKSDFVSLVSHEFRTPLEIILSSADNLDRYHDRLPAEKREQLLRTIKRSVRRMSGMMEEVLVLGRLESDRMTFKPAAFDLQAFCQRVCDEIEAATDKRCPIKLQAIPEQAFGDESVLRHIFTNLLANAVKYSGPGEQVDFIVERQGDDAVCRIVDRGCGIPEADQKRLFEAFHRGSNVRQIPGTGLGLLIVRRCVDLHGGEIQFASTEGKGTMFTVRVQLFSPEQT